MSRGINKVLLIGNLGSDPEIREAKSGNRYCTFSVATSSTWLDKKTNEKTEETQWHRVVAFGKLADLASDFLQKGSKAYIEGSLQTRKWKDDKGIDHYITEVVARNFESLSKRSDSPLPSSADDQSKKRARAYAEASGKYLEDDDLPF